MSKIGNDPQLTNEILRQMGLVAPEIERSAGAPAEAAYSSGSAFDARVVT